MPHFKKSLYDIVLNNIVGGGSQSTAGMQKKREGMLQIKL